MSGERKKLSTIERWVLLVFWLCFGSIGAVTMKVGADVTNNVAHFEQLQLLTATSFEDSVPGREVAIEGLVSIRTPVQFRQFVAYIRQEYQGGDEAWSDDLRITPPLLLVLPDGLIQIKNNYYDIERFSLTWQEDTYLIRKSATNEGTKRYRGFEVGSPVLAVGVVVQGVKGKALEAKWIYGGTSTEYINDLRFQGQLMLWFGLCILATGVIAVKLLA